MRNKKRRSDEIACNYFGRDGRARIGRAVAIAYARGGADLLLSYLNEGEEARETKRLVEECSRTAVLVPGDIKDAKHCRIVVDKAVADLLVNNAAHQASFKEIEEISDNMGSLHRWDCAPTVATAPSPQPIASSVE